MRDAVASGEMRTTLDVDDDVLAAVKNLAENRKMTAGKVISELVRKALLPADDRPFKRNKNGVPLFNFPRKGKKKIVTLELVNKLREELE
jgi:hypothetical protein